MDKKNYWAFRIYKYHAPFLYKELTEGRLRQGWGYDEGQNLKSLTVDNGARRNLPLLKVRKGDILLIPHIQGPNMLTLAEATDDWDKAYRFEISPQLHDFGHIFPAKIRCTIPKYHKEVSSNLHRTLINFARFWSINSYAEDIEHLLGLSEEETKKFVPRENFPVLIENLFEELFDRKNFQEKLYTKCNAQVADTKWEFLLVQALRILFPLPYYQVERVGGISEKEHGTDIKITIQGLLGDSYVIAIQVKDFQGCINENTFQKAIEQINKADAFNNETTKVIEKIILVTRAQREPHQSFTDTITGVKFIFADELKELLLQAASVGLGLASRD